MWTPFDSIHFQHTAQEGYTHEVNHAFFPMTGYVVDKIMFALGPAHRYVLEPYLKMSSDYLYKIIGVMLSTVLCALTALALFMISIPLFRSHSKAIYVSFAFLLCGMTSYFIGFQAESLYTFFFISGLYLLTRGEKHIFAEDVEPTNILYCGIMFGLACLTRANGALLGIIIF